MNGTSTNLVFNPHFSPTRFESTPPPASNVGADISGPRKAQQSGGTTRLRGIVLSRRHKPTQHDLERRVRRIKKGQSEAGITIEPLPKADTTNADLWTLVCQGADWLWQSVPAVNLLPVVGATLDDSAQGAGKAEPLGQGGILVPEFDFRDYQSPREQQTEASTHKDVVRSLGRLAGKENVHVMPSTGATPFIRNVVAEGPYEMLTSGISSSDIRYGPLRDSAEAYFKKEGIEYRRLESEANLANCAFRPDDDLLVMADGDRASIISPKMKRELTRVFGNPANVIHLELNAERLNSHGQLACYDLDLAFHAMTNVRGEPIALVYKPCIREKASQGRMGREDVLQALGALGYKVIEISEEDQRNLVANSLSMDDRSGKILFSSKAASKGLREQLEKHHVTPILPAGDKVLGHPAIDHIPPYGLHCITVSLRRPKAKTAPQKKEL
ncbi:hypothetical protein H6CHR_05254 [Variovorax sp. PBL-H6]|uniref:arginine deiminase-related protein n=1 Tax=Variovorax sp. PBL-H6 TaxID=434009 RepID=UPI0013175E0C|nr:arginine deiminase-related protein [Variovorax sp. PBL-H6]VTU38579.1 hypothetical protein H6CHR_05254 [Variovorax sp. PBL-H6]